MARPEKVAQVEAISTMISDASSVVLADFTGLDVAMIQSLRSACREKGVELKVVKNTLAKRAIEGTPAEGLAQYLEQPTAIAISREAENLSARVLSDFAKENDDKPAFKAGFVDGQVIDITGVLALAKMPGKEEMLSMIMSSLMSPGNGLVGVLQGPARNLVGVLQAIVDKGEG